MQFVTEIWNTLYIEIFVNTDLPIRDRNNSELNIELNRYYSASKLNSGDHMIVCTIHAANLHSNDGLGGVNYAPILFFFSGVWPPKSDQLSSRRLKGTNGYTDTSFEPLRVNIGWAVSAVGLLES